MKSKKISALLAAIMIMSISSNVAAVENNTKVIGISEEVNEGGKISNMIRFSIEEHENFEEYKNSFKIPTEMIENITTNGGYHGASTPERAIDDNINTHWETSIRNSEEFKNDFVIEFEESINIDKITYRIRSTTTGFMNQYEIYGSNSAEGDDFELIVRGSGENTRDTVEISFDETEVRRVKIVFVEAHNGWASISELGFYNDPISREVDTVFEDNLYTILSENYNTLEEIEVLEREVENHPLRNELMGTITLAKDILSGVEVEKSDVITLSQRGNELEDKERLQQIFAGGNLDLTGYYIEPGESIEIYVDANENDILPQAVLAQVGEIDFTVYKPSHFYRFDLKPGKNIITAPADATKAFAVYLSNRAFPEQQEYAPKVVLRGDALERYPIYIDGITDVGEYIEEVMNHDGANMTDVAGDRFLMSAKNTEAQIAYGKGESTPEDLAREMANVIAIFDDIAGLDENSENPIHRSSEALYHMRFTNERMLYAAQEYTHLYQDAARTVLAGEVYGWGFLHEFAHQTENRQMRVLEVTNNIYSLKAQILEGVSLERFVDIQVGVDEFLMSREGGFDNSNGDGFNYFEKLLAVYQVINYFGIEAYSEAYRQIREDFSVYPIEGEDQILISALSRSTGYDLTPHFESYNYNIEDETREFTSQFGTLDKKIEYTLVTAYDMGEDNVQVFNEETKAVIKNITEQGDGFELELGTNDNNEGTIIYEVYRDGELIGISRENSYKDIVDTNEQYEYEIIAYDYRVNESIRSESVSTEGNEYIVTFELNGGIGNFEVQTVIEGESPVVTEEPTREGYIFDGWYSDSDFTTPVVLNEVSIEEDTTFYAKWEETLRLYFNLNGGIGNFPAQTIVKGGSPIRPTEEPTKEGYVFQGWYIDGHLTIPMDFEGWVMERSGSVFAKWAKVSTVTFELNGGIGDFETQTIIEGESLIVNEDPIKNGHRFAGWYADSELTIPVNLNNISIELDTTFYAKWEEVRLLVFNLNGGTGSFPVQVIDLGGHPIRPTEEPTKEGYSFAGWYINRNLTNEMIFEEWIMQNNGFVYAKWAKLNTVTFELNGGTGDFYDQTVITGNSPVVIGQPTKEGYAFGGWYTDEELTIPADLNNISIEEDTIFYAKWEETRLLTFELNGGEGDFQTQRIALGGNPIRPTEVPTKEGYIFAGWYVNIKLTTPMVFEEWVMENDGTVYAKWERAHTLQFNLNGGQGEFPTQTIISGGNPVEPTKIPTREGYTFGGWYVNSRLTVPMIFDEWVMKSSGSVFAKWIPNK